MAQLAARPVGAAGSIPFTFDAAHGIPTEEFLNSCAWACRVFDLLGHYGFYFLHGGLGAYCEQLSQHYQANPIARHTVQKLLLEEIGAQQHMDTTAMVETVRPIMRALNFLHIFTTQFSTTDYTTAECCDHAFAATVRPSCNAVTRAVLEIAFKRAPERDQLICQLADITPAPQNSTATTTSMLSTLRECAGGMSRVLGQLHRLYAALDLDSDEEEEDVTGVEAKP